MEVDTETAPTDVRRVVRLLWRRRFWVVGITALALGLSLVMSSRTADVYAASSRISVADPVSLSTLDFAIARPQRTLEQEVASQLEKVTSPAVREAVERELGPGAALIDSAAAAQVGDTNIIVIRVESRSPGVAQHAANAFADAYVAQQREEAASALQTKADELRAINEARGADIAELDQQLSDLNGTIAALEARRAFAGGPDAAGFPAELRAQLATATGLRSSLQEQRDTLSQDVRTDRGRIDQLDIAAELQRQSGTRILDVASLPRSPIRPTPLRDAAVATVLGLVLGVGAAFARDLFDERVYAPEDVARAAPEIPLLASIPMISSRRRRKRRVETLLHRRSGFAEAYRSLRTSVELAMPDDHEGVLLVTSAIGSEGKTTVVANLAATLAIAGADVIAVDCDLRRPRLAESFSIRPNPGLTSVLLGTATLDRALVEVPVPGGRLRLLASGPLPPNPAEVLGSSRLSTLLGFLGDTADFVIVDSPPVLPVTDPLVLSRAVDATIVVTRNRVTTKKLLRKTVEQLQQSEVPVIGLVFNGHRLALRAADQYGYYQPEADGESVSDSAEWDAVLGGDRDGSLDAWATRTIRRDAAWADPPRPADVDDSTLDLTAPAHAADTPVRERD